VELRCGEHQQLSAVVVVVVRLLTSLMVLVPGVDDQQFVWLVQRLIWRLRAVAVVQDKLRMNSHPMQTVALVVVLWGQQLDLLAVVEVELKVQEVLGAHLDGERRTTELLARHLRVAIATTKAAVAAVAGSAVAAEQTLEMVR
jgi:hypothetical protein